MKLQDKVAVITGAGAGIGRAIAIRFAAEGARVAVTDINVDAAQNVAEKICAEGGCAQAYRCNVMDQAQIEQAMQRATADLGEIDILVNNAGGATVGGRMQPFESCTREYMDVLIGINLMGTLFCTRAVLPRMIERGQGGRIINLTSIRGMAGDKNNILVWHSQGRRDLLHQVAGYGNGQACYHRQCDCTGRHRLETWPRGVRQFPWASGQVRGCRSAGAAAGWG